MAEQDSRSPATSGTVNRQLLTTVDLVAAYVGNNSIRASDLVGLIETIYRTLDQLGAPKAEIIDDTPLVPAVPVKKSITPDFIICLEDGRKFRSLKRHLGKVYNLTPDQYREKWSLPRDYPMVAPDYSAVRSQLAKDIGLGRPAAMSARQLATEAVSAPIGRKPRTRAAKRG